MRRLLALALVVSGAVLSGCAPTRAADKPHIVVTTNILGDVVQQMVGDDAEVTTLMKPNADPRSFEISAQQAARISEADLVVANGLGLEEGLQQHLNRVAKAGGKVFAAGDHLKPLPYSSGDAAGTPDPHFRTDPARMTDVVNALEEALSGIKGIEQPAVAERAATYRNRLEQLDREMGESFASIPSAQRALVTNHHVFGYLADRFKFRVIGAVIPGGTTLAAPSAADLHSLAEAIKDAGVPAIFAESSQPDRLVQVLAREAGIDVDVIALYTESLSEPGQDAETYLAMMRTNTNRITTALTKTTTHQRGTL
ncbi:zinc ABC transporter substrate-binding protein AztC [Sinomonas sp. JGH33]|uniref:Zinc ABC transporter substrate-binding protein AztC n=1 Tax=Sinomonas terricola TaxID=3110330 RepID=A0ABU5T3A7_9MICC|nr:zinc ABC transporter substrate-binding protein AztC [Sinomonas sp. JGH33]MEA5453956.1 zinc ABC transporter substrate-binding protein AztC [Sinomonas sp. JGH33]